ncbi:hypothetical protein [Staphylococcus aureus]|uniref:Uncharacterized protein n=2 Tax=Staphylococcus aureus TaxID=1280 RepID=A0AAW4YC44_STAAU|nr:hypothetical protein [Staphylococcus aureus]WGL32260.1 hypothetical protein [Staphylococcus phage phiST9-B]HDH6430556.1 hypothetical protein [Staphylococcus aureus MRSA-Lux-31]HDX9043007.1 hypothetical protein [Staphylococcus aureus 2009-60-800-3]ASC50361.1 hypothetical protein A2V17_04305 [Staphylococcus aureus]EGQ1337400.1 hypothetical protein [Staphylococcus aureus]
MEYFNYNNRKKLVLENVDIDKVKEVYKDYELINYAIKKQTLYMNDYEVAKVSEKHLNENINNLRGTVNLDEKCILSLTYL